MQAEKYSKFLGNVYVEDVLRPIVWQPSADRPDPAHQVTFSSPQNKDISRNLVSGKLAMGKAATAAIRLEAAV